MQVLCQVPQKLIHKAASLGKLAAITHAQLLGVGDKTSISIVKDAFLLFLSLLSCVFPRNSKCNMSVVREHSANIAVEEEAKAGMTAELVRGLESDEKASTNARAATIWTIVGCVRTCPSSPSFQSLTL